MTTTELTAQTAANNTAIRDLFREFAMERALLEIRIDELLAENARLRAEMEECK